MKRKEPKTAKPLISVKVRPSFAQVLQQLWSKVRIADLWGKVRVSDFESLELKFAGILHRLNLDSIRARILLLSALATLIPSITMGTLAYRTMTQYLGKDVQKQLHAATVHTTRELELWTKERRYELRVFASSYEVSENVDTLLRPRASDRTQSEAKRRLRGYLQSIRSKFSDYEEILVLSRTEGSIATTASATGDVKLPARWQRRVEADTPVVGDPYFDKNLETRVLTMAVPIRRADASLLGFLVAKCNLRGVTDILKSSQLEDQGHVYLVQVDGHILMSSRWNPTENKNERLPISTVQTLSERAQAFYEYEDLHGENVLGSMQWLSQVDWGVVAELPEVQAYAKALELRQLTVLVVLVLLVVIGLVSYVVGQTIVGPVGRLATAAAGVARGKFDVTVQEVGHGELGYLTDVFNRMLERLRQAQDSLRSTNRTLSRQNQALESVAITDTLTGLFNRRYMMEKLADEMTRSLRLDHVFSILMLDLDNFKKYNDTYGHLAGDQVLRKVAHIFKESIRKIDVAARYGGEEFLIILPELSTSDAMTAAERIRKRIAAGLYGMAGADTAVTISIGAAGYPEHGETAEALIASADGALYEAKRCGRNCVVLAGISPVSEEHAQKGTR
jgi:diguanylate cyclase (GGDEF)-like protein